MARKQKIMENEKHPLDDLKNEEITEKRKKWKCKVKAALSELAMKDENDKALEKKNKSLNPKKSKKEDDWDDEDDDLDDDK